MGFLQAQSLCPGLGLSPKYTDQLGCQQKIDTLLLQNLFNCIRAIFQKGSF